jgi:hypothetical protein
MNIALWIVQGIVALLFFVAGIMKLTQPYDKLNSWLTDGSLLVPSKG